MTDTPLVHIGGKIIGTDLAPHQDKTDIGRTAHHLAYVHCHGVVTLVGIGNGIVAHLDTRGNLKRCARAHNAQIKSGARNQRLKDRAGLVGIRHQTKVHVLGLGVFQIGLVVGRIRAGGQDLSSRRVGHQGRPVFGLRLLDRLGQGIFRGALNVDVDRRHDIHAINRGNLFIGTARDVAAISCALAHKRAIRSGQKLIVLFFESSQASVVHVHDAQHLRSQVSIRVNPLHRLLKEHAG